MNEDFKGTYNSLCPFVSITDVFLATSDVSSFYTIVPLDKGIQAV